MAVSVCIGSSWTGDGLTLRPGLNMASSCRPTMYTLKRRKWDRWCAPTAPGLRRTVGEALWRQLIYGGAGSTHRSNLHPLVLLPPNGPAHWSFPPGIAPSVSPGHTDSD